MLSPLAHWIGQIATITPDRRCLHWLYTCSIVSYNVSVHLHLTFNGAPQGATDEHCSGKAMNTKCYMYECVIQLYSIRWIHQIVVRVDFLSYHSNWNLRAKHSGGKLLVARFKIGRYARVGWQSQFSPRPQAHSQHWKTWNGPEDKETPAKHSTHAMKRNYTITTSYLVVVEEWDQTLICTRRVLLVLHDITILTEQVCLCTEQNGLILEQSSHQESQAVHDMYTCMYLRPAQHYTINGGR